MCIAVVKPVGADVSDDTLRSCVEYNRDGIGYCFVEDGRVRVKKGFFVETDRATLGGFLPAFRADLERVGDKSPFFIHFRASTGGGRTPENCHPFLFDHGALMHNGYFFSAVGNKSDTNLLTEGVSKHLKKEKVLAAKEDLAKFWGVNNKVGILYTDASYVIINEEQGVWDSGVWFSNRGYLPITRRSSHWTYGGMHGED